MFSEEPRLEAKFTIDERQVDRMLRWIRLHPARFATAYPDRIVNNIYFDTPDCAAFADNLAGISARMKVRYRWYGDSVAPDIGSLEVKCRRNQYCWKIRYPILVSPYRDGATWSEIRNALTNQLPAPGRHLLQMNPCPILTNRYSRRYFVSSDQNVRVTVDTAVGVCDQRLRSRPRFDDRAHLTRSAVLEIKFAAGVRDQVAGWLDGLQSRATRHSKYTAGLCLIDGA